MKKDRFSFIRYSNCWEDTDILLDALDIKEGQIGLSVCSGGDNTLSMLTKNPAEVIAFDLNPTQLYCLEYKIAAFRALEYDELLCLFGVERCDHRDELFLRIKPFLSDEAAHFFEEDPKIVHNGIVHIGKFEHYFRLFKRFLLPFICSQKKLDAFLKMSDTKEQRKFYDKHINNRRLKLIVKIYFGSRVMGALGRDKSFFDFVEEKKALSREVKERFEFGIEHTSNSSNLYLHYVFKNRFYEDALPHYLKRENFDVIKANLEKIKLLRSDLLGIKDKKFDFINLSDIFEYMSREDFLKNVQKAESLCNDGARIAYWNMQNSQYIKDIQDSGFKFKEELSNALFLANRSCFYRDFSVYERKN